MRVPALTVKARAGGHDHYLPHPKRGIRLPRQSDRVIADQPTQSDSLVGKRLID